LTKNIVLPITIFEIDGVDGKKYTHFNFLPHQDMIAKQLKVTKRVVTHGKLDATVPIKKHIAHLISLLPKTNLNPPVRQTGKSL
jgi:hypothetical protein